MTFGKAIVIPSFLMVLMFAALFRHVDWAELLFVKNLFSSDRVAKFPTWYPQVMAQLLLGTYLLFRLPGAFKILRTREGAFIVFLTSIAVLVITSPPSLPHLPLQHLWNFTLGWVVYIFALRQEATLSDKFVAAALALFAAFVAYGPYQTAFFTLAVGALSLIFVRRIVVPAGIAYVCRLLSRATFAIFLWHRFFFEVYERHCLTSGLRRGAFQCSCLEWPDRWRSGSFGRPPAKLGSPFETRR